MLCRADGHSLFWGLWSLTTACRKAKAQVGGCTADGGDGVVWLCLLHCFDSGRGFVIV
jgi:hypothetical protein